MFLLTIGFFAGVINSLAGGGSLISFPALVFVGVPPVIANATNTFSTFFGYLTGTYAFKNQLKNCRNKLVPLVFISFLGSVLGALLLVNISNVFFNKLIPWLFLLGLLIFILDTKFTQFRFTQKRNSNNFFLYTIFFILSLYGGFFNGGLGILLLSFLSLAGFKNIHTMNGIKLLLSASIAFTSILIFLFFRKIDFFYAGILLVSIGAGSFFAAKISVKIAQDYIINSVIFIGLGLIIYFFIQ